MARGPKKHMKRIAAPSHWMLDKLTGVWAPRPSSGPHKLRECLPLCVLLRNRLKYALNYKEAKQILVQRLVRVDGKIRCDHTYPAGFMDVITIEKTKENFRLLYDTKGRFVVHKIAAQEAGYKLCKVKKVTKSAKGVSILETHDGRTIRFADPNICANDSVRVDVSTGQVMDWVKFEMGHTCMMTGGNNIGRVGVITQREKHPGSFEIVHLKDAEGHSFATRLQNVMVIGDKKAFVSLPKREGVKLNIIDDRKRRMGATSDEVAVA